MKIQSLILASASPRRVELLKQLRIEFVVVPSQATELEHENLTAGEISQLNAYRKARQVAKKHPDSVVLGADTVVCRDTQLFGKPASRADAVRVLLELSNRTHTVVTGVCLMHLRSHRQRIFSETSFVTFHPLTRSQVESYVDLTKPFDKAGAYGVQDRGELLIESIIGSFTNVVGLPLARLREELELWDSSRSIPLH